MVLLGRGGGALSGGGVWHSGGVLSVAGIGAVLDGEAGRGAGMAGVLAG